VGERSQRTYVPPFELAAYFGWMGR
jgi:hypothetical protein